MLQAIADPRYLFTTVNNFLIGQGKEALFDVHLVGVDKEINLVDGLVNVKADKIIGEVKKTDLIIIPAIGGNLKETVALNDKFFPWIIAQREKGAEVASLCLGAYVLAATGLLDGKKCSTHWNFINDFRATYPNIDVQDGSIVTEENGLYSSGGAHSYWTLLLHLVEKYTNRETAILASKYFAVDIGRTSQNSFIIFEGQKSHNDNDVLQTQMFIENNIDEKISVEELADKANMSRRNFERRFKQATNNSVLEYIQRTKIEAAKRSLETSRKNINEIMYEVGYNDNKAFRGIFKKITGLSPIEYKSKYNKLNKVTEIV